MNFDYVFGNVDIDSASVETHRDTYLLHNISVVSVRRPFLAGALMCSAGFGGFGIAFSDLLYPAEIGFIIGGIIASVFAGIWLGQLKLLSRDLRNSELSDAIWGSYSQLNRIRRDIVSAIRCATPEGKQ
ncbi:MAG: hypothetical protein COA47_14360 [Robiginitomaculum sp.]|nr:MAG: hypothetical protein COA47_14360 [Robiginitomaculum sp.]